MPYSLCDMDCDQDINKSELEEHCSDCLCTSGLEDLGQQDVPATKAWRPTSVVEERDRLKTLSNNDGRYKNEDYSKDTDQCGFDQVCLIIFVDY